MDIIFRRDGKASIKLDCFVLLHTPHHHRLHSQEGFFKFLSAKSISRNSSNIEHAGLNLTQLFSHSRHYGRLGHYTLCKKRYRRRSQKKGGLENELQKNGFKRIRVIGDGRCLFRAMTKGMARESERNLTKREERQEADRLRMQTWDEVTFKRRAEFTKACVVEGDYDRYIEESRSNSFFGGYPELLAMSDMLRRRIQVFTLTNNGREITKIEEFGSHYMDTFSSLGRKDDGVTRLLLCNHHYELLIYKKK